MNKRFIYSLAATFITAAVTLSSFTACSNEDLVADTVPGSVSTSEPVVYSVKIAATLGEEGTRAVSYNDVTGGLTSTFRTTDNIGVYNKTKGCLALKQGGDVMYLHADANAKEANLTGGLAFYDTGNTYNEVETGDVLLLIYNGEGSGYNYQSKENDDHSMGQKGTLESLSDYDFATAEVTVTDVSGTGTADDPYTLTTTDASFTNVQSMFKLTFAGMPEEFSSNPSSFGINKITIHSVKNKLICNYNPANGDVTYEDIQIILGGESISAAEQAREANGVGNVVYAALRFMPLGEGETDEITFTIETTAGTYIATKTSPAGGFQNGKYYTSTITATGAVQLWEDGPYWAPYNVGASAPEEFGYYFWWGDIVGYTRSGGTWEEKTSRFYDVTWVSSTGEQMSNSPFLESSCPTMNKENSSLLSEGWIDATGNLAPEHDAAHVHWGGEWRMPTSGEIEALINNCTTTWTTINGVKGRLVTGKDAYADRSIFLPAAGYGSSGEREEPAGSNNFRTVVCLFNVGSQGHYWSSTPQPGRLSYAWRLHFNSQSFSQQYYNYRYYAQSVRPVRDAN